MRDRHERWTFRTEGVLATFDDLLSVRVKTLDNGQELVFVTCCVEKQANTKRPSGLRTFCCPQCLKTWEQVSHGSTDSEEHSHDGTRSGRDGAGGSAHARDDDRGDDQRGG